MQKHVLCEIPQLLVPNPSVGDSEILLFGRLFSAPIKNSMCTHIFYDTRITTLQMGNPPNTLFCSLFFFPHAGVLLEKDNVRTKDVVFVLSVLLILQAQREPLKFPRHVHGVGHPNHPQWRRPSEQRKWICISMSEGLQREQAGIHLVVSRG